MGIGGPVLLHDQLDIFDYPLEQCRRKASELHLKGGRIMAALRRIQTDQGSYIRVLDLGEADMKFLFCRVIRY